MIFNIANKLGAMTLAMGCVLVPVTVYAQTDQTAQPSAAVAAQEESAVEQPQAAGEAKAPGEANVPEQTGQDAAAPTEETDAVEMSAEAGAQAQREAGIAAVKKGFEKEFPGLVLDSVKPTRFAGIYELRIGTDLLYTNEQVQYVMQGSLIDARNKEDITAKSMDELMRVSFDVLPLQSAIKQVKGDGSRKMVMFEDPNCGYCKRLHQTLEGMDNYTVYTLLFPILSPDSTLKARNIWCAADRVQAWRNQMLKNQAPANAQCETPIEANLALGRKLLVRGTPAIFFEDGSRVNGALPRDALEQRLDAATAAVAAASAPANSTK